MQEALPYKRLEALPVTSVKSASHLSEGRILLEIMNVVKENPVIVIGKRGCCMCHVVIKLLLGLGVNPPIFEIDVEVDESILLNSLCNTPSVVLLNGEGKGKGKGKGKGNLQFPMVFVGGEIFGGLDKVMTTHLCGDLIPILKQAGALWL